jgi:hypothetical protein
MLMSDVLTLNKHIAMSKVINISDDLGRLLFEGWVC